MALSPVKHGTQDEKIVDVSNTTKSFEINVKPLNDLINLNNKSRNNRNNLINNKSSLFNSDKVLSQYSASYNNKNHTYTQVLKNNPAKPIKANSNSKPRLNSAVSNTKKTPSKVQVNLSQKSYQSISIRTSQKVIENNTAQEATQDKPLHTEDQQKTKSNFSVFLNKNLNLINTQSNKGI
jgi:hypothetical protein